MGEGSGGGGEAESESDGSLPPDIVISGAAACFLHLHCSASEVAALGTSGALPEAAALVLPATSTTDKAGVVPRVLSKWAPGVATALSLQSLLQSLLGVGEPDSISDSEMGMPVGHTAPSAPGLNVRVLERVQRSMIRLVEREAEERLAPALTMVSEAVAARLGVKGRSFPDGLVDPAARADTGLHPGGGGPAEEREMGGTDFDPVDLPDLLPYDLGDDSSSRGGLLGGLEDDDDMLLGRSGDGIGGELLMEDSDPGGLYDGGLGGFFRDHGDGPHHASQPSQAGGNTQRYGGTQQYGMMELPDDLDSDASLAPPLGSVGLGSGGGGAVSGERGDREAYVAYELAAAEAELAQLAGLWTSLPSTSGERRSIASALVDLVASSGSEAVAVAKARVKASVSHLLQSPASAGPAAAAGGGGRGAPVFPPGMAVPAAASSGGAASGGGRQLKRLRAIAVFGWAHEHLLTKGDGGQDDGSGSEAEGALQKLEEVVGALSAVLPLFCGGVGSVGGRGQLLAAGRQLLFPGGGDNLGAAAGAGVRSACCSRSRVIADLRALVSEISGIEQQMAAWEASSTSVAQQVCGPRVWMCERYTCAVVA